MKSTPIECEIIVFPPSRQIGKARRLAELMIPLQIKEERKHAASYYSRQRDRFDMQMIAAGYSLERRKAELELFEETLAIEMGRFVVKLAKQEKAEKAKQDERERMQE